MICFQPPGVNGCGRTTIVPITLRVMFLSGLTRSVRGTLQRLKPQVALADLPVGVSADRVNLQAEKTALSHRIFQISHRYPLNH